ncbi:MAG: hypothetical protein ACXABY_07945 [Candidatus Thorarchaeota archaeon]|jgi:hypothetical protein
MRRTILIVVLLVIIGFLIWSNYAKAYEPKLHVATSIDEVETYESVLVMVTSDPLPYGNNSTIASNHVVELVFFNLGTDEVIYSGNLTLKSGTATWKFMVIPDWGQFTGIIEVYDPLIDSRASTSIEVEYSQDHLFDEWTKYIEERENRRDDETKKTNDTNSTLTTTSVGMFWIIVPLFLLRLQHTTARKNNEDSLWDKFWDRFFGYSETTSRFTMYLTDPNYRHSTSAKPYFLAAEDLDYYHSAELDEEMIIYEKQQLRERMKKIDPELVPEVDDPSISLDALKEALEEDT